MKICGIVAEYNPFHNGHHRHLALTRRLLGPDTAIVCVMSGNYVQRGEPAVLEKYARAEAAARCGADLVLELPLPACLSSAEGFALGGVSLLNALGCVTYLSFGSESGEIAPIRRAAALPAQAQARLQLLMREGLTYAAAVQRAVAEIDPEAGALYASPNNTLGIAYCAALARLGSGIQPVTVRREGAAHDSREAADGLPSASYLRALLREGRAADCRPLMPAPSFEILAREMEQGAAPVFPDALDTALLSHLRRLSPADLARYAGGGDGFEHRLWDAVRAQADFPAVCRAAQTRRYPLARVRRALFRAWLGLPADLPNEAAYARVLAVGARGRDVLRRMKTTCRIPVLVKPAAARRETALADALARDALADDLYALAYPAPHLHVGGAHLRKTPYLEK